MSDSFNIYKQDDRFRYQLLGRLKADCDYYLSYGNRCTDKLWANTETEHIETMKKLYNSFDEDKKPEWLTYEEILDYKNKMVG